MGETKFATWNTDIEAGIVRFAEWFSDDRRPSEGDLIHHAWMQGAFSESRYANPRRDICYSQRDYRLAWFAGFDIARRIRTLGEAAVTIVDALDEKDADLAALRVENQRFRELLKTAGQYVYAHSHSTRYGIGLYEKITGALAQNPIAHEQCQHEWKECDEDIGGDRTVVKCVRCGVPGERDDKTGEVYYPAT